MPTYDEIYDIIQDEVWWDDPEGEYGYGCIAGIYDAARRIHDLMKERLEQTP